ncbi:MAG: hypothetical protein NTX17_02240 [Candidatus Eisenbacteria bacterium]|nr:hypothetical protein [Candidatus Eisenbacteria bacterium]
MNRRKRYYDNEDERPNRKLRVIREMADEKDWVDELEVDEDFEEEFNQEFMDEEDYEEYE